MTMERKRIAKRGCGVAAPRKKILLWSLGQDHGEFGDGQNVLVMSSNFSKTTLKALTTTPTPNPGPTSGPRPAAGRQGRTPPAARARAAVAVAR